MKREYLDALIQSFLDHADSAGVFADGWAGCMVEVTRLEELQRGLGIIPYRERTAAR